MPHLIDPLPKTMLAIEIIEPGGPEKLSPTKLPLIKPPKLHLLVKVSAAGVNRPDIAKRLNFDYTILSANKISVSHPSALFCI
ncbi:hypothetical protein ARSQ2_02031 [Arsenophonus endosymbiont of Bemisia tabaci Q2]|nr:hypothetical protein ARSQ2_02031 [Arsenophonus endosymbiont of Bemisia tabaci Q2]